MVIISNKKFKKMQTTNLVVGCTGIGMGVIGVGLGTASLIKDSVNKKKTNSDIDLIQQHINALERASKKTCKEVAVIQETLMGNGLLR